MRLEFLESIAASVSTWVGDLAILQIQCPSKTDVSLHVFNRDVQYDYDGFLILVLNKGTRIYTPEYVQISDYYL